MNESEFENGENEADHRIDGESEDRDQGAGQQCAAETRGGKSDRDQDAISAGKSRAKGDVYHDSESGEKHDNGGKREPEDAGCRFPLRG